MSDKIRWRFGETQPVFVDVDSKTTVDIGDLVFLENGKAFAANVKSTQFDLTDRFLGVAMEKSAVGETRPIRVATSGVFEYDCREATFALGDLVGADYRDDGTLEPQKVVKVESPQNAIGKVVRAQSVDAPTVYVTIRSTVFK